jgi:hypothetical protein
MSNKKPNRFLSYGEAAFWRDQIREAMLFMPTGNLAKPGLHQPA